MSRRPNLKLSLVDAVSEFIGSNRRAISLFTCSFKKKSRRHPVQVTDNSGYPLTYTLDVTKGWMNHSVFQPTNNYINTAPFYAVVMSVYQLSPEVVPYLSLDKVYTAFTALVLDKTKAFRDFDKLLRAEIETILSEIDCFICFDALNEGDYAYDFFVCQKCEQSCHSGCITEWAHKSKELATPKPGQKEVVHVIKCGHCQTPLF